MRLILRLLKRFIISNIFIETKTETGQHGQVKIFRVWFLDQVIFEMKFDLTGGVVNTTRKDENLTTSID